MNVEAHKQPWFYWKSALRTIGMYTIGLMIMATSNTNAVESFNLKSPQDYFSDPKTVALLQSALAGNIGRAKQLVTDGANPNDEGPRDNPYNRIRLLHYAIAGNNFDAVRVLMAVGADPELDTLGGGGPAMLFAMTLNNVEMFSLMLDLRPISSLAKGSIKTLLFESASRCKACLEELLKRGVAIDFPNGAGETLLMDAMDAQDYDLAEWLVLKGAAVVREPSRSGGTPANTVQFHLNKFKPGSPTYNKVLHLKELMEARGATFPAPTPKEIRAQRGQK